MGKLCIEELYCIYSCKYVSDRPTTRR